MQSLVLIQNRQVFSRLNTRLSFLHRSFSNHNRSAFFCHQKSTFSLFGANYFGKLIVGRTAGPNHARVRVNRFQTSTPSRQDPFRSGNNESKPPNAGGRTPNNDPKKSATILIMSLILTVVTYAMLDKQIRKAQAEMQTRMNAQTSNEVF